MFFVSEPHNLIVRPTIGPSHNYPLPLKLNVTAITLISIVVANSKKGNLTDK